MFQNNVRIVEPIYGDTLQYQSKFICCWGTPGYGHPVHPVRHVLTTCCIGHPRRPSRH